MSFAVAQYAYVRRSGYALVHQLKGIAVEALDAVLDRADTGRTQHTDLLGGHVGLRFELQPQVPARRFQLGQQIPVVGHVDDVVGSHDVQDLVPAYKMVEFCPEALGRLGPVVDRLPVEAAEGALVALSPPTAAVALHEL